MVKCMVLNCKNYAGKKCMAETIKFHRFPKDPKICKEWIKVCRKKISIKNDSICSEHFEESDYQLRDILLNTPLKKRHLKRDAIPTINVGLSTKKLSAKKRRQEKEIKKRLIEEAMSCYERSKDTDCTQDPLSQASESPERKWLLTELIVEPICSLEYLDENEDEPDDFEKFEQNFKTTERLEIIDEEEPSTTDRIHIQSKKIKSENASDAKNSAQQTNNQENERTPPITESVTQTENAEKIDKAVQTEIEYEVALEFRIMKAENETRKLRFALNKAIKKRQRQKAKEEHLRKIFTPGQLKRLCEPDKKSHWSDEDQIAARDLYLAGIRTYEILRNRGFPLPSSSTYRRWAAQSKLIPKSDSAPDPVSETESEIESIPAPESASACQPDPDTELVSALESIPKAGSVTESEPIDKLDSIKQSSIQMYWNEFMDTIA